jgi:hypothetical protein
MVACLLQYDLRSIPHEYSLNNLTFAVPADGNTLLSYDFIMPLKLLEILTLFFFCPAELLFAQKCLHSSIRNSLPFVLPDSFR